MAEVLCGGVLTVESEFQGGLTAACGPNAAGSAARWSGQSASTPSTLDVYKRMVSSAVGVNSPNGASTLGELAKTLTSLGYHLAYPQSGEGVTAFARRMAGSNAVVLEVSNGQAFRDELTGQGEDAWGLQYHFVCVLGRNTGGVSPRAGGKTLPAGFWVADGDNNVQNLVNGARVHRGLNSQLVYYSDVTLARAQPYGAFAVLPKVAIAGGVTMGIPAGWKDDGARLTAPNGVVVVKGFRDHILAAANWPAQLVPLAAEFGTVSGTRQQFQLDLNWTSANNAITENLGSASLAISNVQSQLDAANKEIAQLKAQLAAAQAAAGDPHAAALAKAVLDLVTAQQSSGQKAA